MRWIIRGILGLAVLIGLAVGALVALPSERIATLAADRIGAATGRQVTLSGVVRPTLWPHLGVRAEAFSIGNPDWVRDGPLIAADALSIRVPWSAVLAQEVRIDEIALIGPRIALVRGADGRTSWDFGSRLEDGGPTGAEGASGPAPVFALDRATIREGRVLYVDQASGQRFEIDALDADIALPASGGATIEAGATINAVALSLTGRIDDLTAFLSGDVRPVAAALDWSGGEMEFDGVASLDPALEGDIRVEAEDIGPLATLAGVAAPVLPEGLGRDRMAVTGRLTVTREGTAHLRGGTIELDDLRAGAELDVTPGADRPMIRGAIRADTLRLPLVDAASGGSGGGGGASAGWSRDRIDVSGLFAADLDVAVAVAALRAGDLELAPVALRVTNSAGRAVFDIDRIGVFDGVVSGDFVVNGRGGLSVRGDLNLVNIQLSPMMAALAGTDRLDGTGNAAIRFLGVGNDMATLMGSLDGDGDVALGAGAILGLDLAGMIRTRDASYRGDGARTVYDSLTAAFTIAEGVLRNDDLLLDAPWGEVAGAGAVDLGARTLDYRVIPTLMRDASGNGGINVPILFSGPWASLSIRPDLEYLARQELAAEAERLEAEARARLAEEADRLEAEARARANAALGLDLEEGDTVEDAQDALEQRLRDEAQDQLRRILGGGN